MSSTRTIGGGGRVGVSEGRGSYVANLLDMVDRGCRRLMKTGGGHLPQEVAAGPKMTPERWAEALRLYEAGEAQATIGERIGVAQDTVSKHLIAHNIAGRMLSPEGVRIRDARLLSLLRRGVPARRVAQALRVELAHVERHGKAAGLIQSEGAA